MGLQRTKSIRLAYASKGWYIIESIPKDIRSRRKFQNIGLYEGKEIYIPRTMSYTRYGVPIRIKDRTIVIKFILSHKIYVRRL